MTDNRAIELLPCPFCGGKASKRLFYGARYGVYCDECDARVGGLFNTEAEAIAEWNTRWNTRAELGNGTLTAEQVREATDDAKAELLESCEYVGDMYQRRRDVLRAFGKIEQAIADELNAKLGSRTCEVESEFWHDHGGYDSDTYEYVLSCGHSVEWLDSEPPRHCPDCGKAVNR